MSPAEWKFHCAADMTAPDPTDDRDDDIGYFGEGLVEFDEEYGGAAGWLAANGLTDAELAALRERLRRT